MTYEEAFKTAAEQAYHSGPPPSVGWWPTKAAGNCAMRWWDGLSWGWGCGPEIARLEGFIELCAETKNQFEPHEIEWAHPWW